MLETIAKRTCDSQWRYRQNAAIDQEGILPLNGPVGTDEDEVSQIRPSEIKLNIFVKVSLSYCFERDYRSMTTESTHSTRCEKKKSISHQVD